MRRLPQLSLSSAPIYASTFVIATLVVFIGLFWAFNEYETYQRSVANIRQNYQDRYRQRASEELKKIIDFVEYKKSQQDSRIDYEIREKVQSAYSIASHIYSFYKDEKSTEELREMVVELLRPIRWDNGLGYYFAGGVDSSILDLFADKPHYEGVNFQNIPEENSRSVFQQLAQLAREKGAGTLRYYWTKPEVDGSYYPKISFVKYFQPFDWFIGAGIYIDEMEERIQKDILEQVGQIRFGKEGKVLVFRLDGTIIGGLDRRILGRSVMGLTDVEKVSYGLEMLKIAQSDKGSGYLEYTESEQGSGNISKRLAFIERYNNWSWVFVTSVSMMEMERAIRQEAGIYKKITFTNGTLFLILFVIAVAILMLLSYVYSIKIKQGIDLFTEFFRKAADSNVRIEKKQLNFREFEILGDFANRLIEDRLEKEQLLKNITDSMPSMLIGIDSKFRIMQWNRLAETKTGVDAAEVEGKLLADILPRMQKHENEIIEVITSGIRREIRRVPHNIAGEMYYESITIYPLIFEGTQGAVLRLDDVTESVRMEEVMIQSEKMLSVGGLAAGIAHEVNNPLASVIQNLQVVQKRLSPELPKNLSVANDLGASFTDILDYLDHRGVLKMLGTMHRDSQRAAKLIHNMLSFSRKSQSVFGARDLRKLLDDSLALSLADFDLKKKYDFRQICLKKEYDENVRKVSCEETNIQQVFLNIITNTAHAIAENKDGIEIPMLTLRVKDDKGMARVEIEDNGAGIDAETRKRIFEPFFTTKGVGKGTGLGLSIAYFIVHDQHHGTMEVRSEPGQGSIFIIRLPYEHKDKG